MVSFGNLSAQAGEKSKGFLAVPGTDFTIPATLICGERPGKTVLVSGGVHSCEYVGIEAAIRLAAELAPAEICGTVLILHPVNRPGFEARTPSIVPWDGCNLNREFPGRADGGRGARPSGWRICSSRSLSATQMLTSTCTAARCLRA